MVALDEDAARLQFASAIDLGFQSCAIVLMHGYKFPHTATPGRNSKVSRVHAGSDLARNQSVGKLISW